MGMGFLPGRHPNRPSVESNAINPNVYKWENIGTELSLSSTQ